MLRSHKIIKKRLAFYYINVILCILIFSESNGKNQLNLIMIMDSKPTITYSHVIPEQHPIITYRPDINTNFSCFPQKIDSYVRFQLIFFKKHLRCFLYFK